MRLKHFSIRDLLWLTLVVALVVGWWIHSSRLAIQRDEARQRIAELDEMVMKADILLAQQNRANRSRTTQPSP